MTDPRIEAAARELKRLFSDDESTTDDTWIACAKCVMDAADVAAWRPMSEAPKDGTLILVTVKHIGCDVVSFWGAGWRETTNGLMLRDNPTHWQPLPKPPAPCK